MKNHQFVSRVHTIRFSDQKPLFLLGFSIVLLHFVWLSMPSWWPNQPNKTYSVTFTKPLPHTRTSVIRPFNPNFITDYKGYLLGMKPAELDRLFRFRAQGKYIQTAKEFQQITGVDNTMLTKISPYFKFPVWKTNSIKPFFRNNTIAIKKTKKRLLQDINQASIAELEEVRGIGPVLAKRIIQFRDQLGGFFDLSQLMDVWGIKIEVYQEACNHFTIQKPSNAIKLNLNQSSIQTIRQFPYFNAYIAREIVKRRTQVENLTLEDLTTVNTFPVEKLKNIALYLAF